MAPPASPSPKKRSASPDAASGAPAAKAARVAEGLGVHIFTRDLRIDDNLTLAALSEALGGHADRIRPIFVFTPEQTKTSDYFSPRCFAFLLAALGDLASRVEAATGGKRRLEFFFGTHEEVLEDILASGEAVSYVSIAHDFTPYAAEREERIRKVCEKHKGVSVLCVRDEHSLTPKLLEVRSGTGTIYKVFTPFWKNVSKITPIAPAPSVFAKVASFGPSLEVLGGAGTRAYSLKRARAELLCTDEHRAFVDSYAEKTDNTVYGVLATRRWAVERIENYLFDDYQRHRDDTEYNCTLLSSHLKFGVLSAREVVSLLVQKRKKNVRADSMQSFVREVYFRDFYQYVGYHFPGVLAGMKSGYAGDKNNMNFAKDFSRRPANTILPIAEGNADSVQWRWGKDADADFIAWSKGETGIPLVDAAMREANQTGFMHNRGRMVTAMFLTKNLLIDWRRGEKYFAQTLVDYDPLSNSAGWQWSSSTGADGSPYFRVMNPQSQVAKVDKSAAYVKRWVPELKSVDAKGIHKWDEDKVRSKYASVKYPAPMVDLKASRAKAIDVFKRSIVR